MARTATNDAKRVEMAEIMAAVKATSASTKEIAAALHVTDSCVSAWARGTSMGTNDQRDQLRKLGTLAGLVERARASVGGWAAVRAEIEAINQRYMDEARKIVAVNDADGGAAYVTAKLADARGTRDRFASQNAVRVARGETLSDFAITLATFDEVEELATAQRAWAHELEYAQKVVAAGEASIYFRGSHAPFSRRIREIDAAVAVLRAFLARNEARPQPAQLALV